MDLQKTIGNPTQVRDKIFYEKSVFINGTSVSLIFSQNELKKLELTPDQFDKSFDLSIGLFKTALERYVKKVDK